MKRATRAEWARRVARWRRSGLSAKEFAAREGFNASTLTFWSWKLGTLKGSVPQGRRTRGGATPGRKQNHATEPDASDAFVGFDLVAPRAASSDLELVLDDGLRVRVPAGFDAPTLERMVALLRREGR
jgi:transposase